MIAFDRWNVEELERTMADDGVDLPLKEFGQGFKDLGPATAAFEVKVLNRGIVHNGNPVLTWMAGNVSLETDAADNWKPSKKKSRERIDAIVALVMAVDRVSTQPPEPDSWYVPGQLEL